MKAEHFSDIEKNLFQQALNQGTAKAGSALTELLGEEIRVMVATIETPSKRPCIDDFYESTDLDASVVSQIFHSVFAGIQVSGCAFLIVPGASCQALCGYFLAHTPFLDQELEVREVVLSETGNIILNSALGGLANSLRIPMENELPVVHLGRVEAFRCLINFVRKEYPQDGDGLLSGIERRRPPLLQEHVVQAKVKFGAAQTTFYTELLIFFDTDAIPVIRGELNNAIMVQQVMPS